MLLQEQKQSLVEILTNDIADFEAYADHIVDTPDGPLMLQDNGANVLCVAHLDYVLCHRPRFSKRGRKVHCGQLDDRLGAWIALHLLQEFGVNVDVLLTDSEEVGASTAQYFDFDKRYNWLVQFDRRGTDVVMYDYDCAEYRAIVESYGFRVGHGSFSDICYLQQLNVAGFNVGTGYHDEHTHNCYADLRQTIGNVERFARMWHDYHDIELPHVSRWDDWESTDNEWQSSYDDRLPWDDSVDVCAGCGEDLPYLDWDCNRCGSERSDISMQEFLNRLTRDELHERYSR